jgi:hypothetical protein
MVSFRFAPSTPILLAAYAPAVYSPEQWLDDLAVLCGSGATAIAAAIPWGYSATELIDFCQLCQQLGLGLVFDLQCLAQPPLDLLRQHPAAILRDPTGQPILSRAGELQAIMLHPALRDQSRNWLKELAGTLQKPPLSTVMLHGFLSEAAESIIQELHHWQHADQWPASVYGRLPVLNLANGWPFQQQLIWNTHTTTASAVRGLALLSQVAGSDLAQAVPPASSDDMRAAWADAGGVDITLRHNDTTTYLSIQRIRSEPYSGVLTYRNATGELLHVHANIGPSRNGVVLLRDEEIIGAAFEGDTSEGVWLLRAMRSSVVFNGGAGAVVPCGDGILLLATQSGRFQIRRPHPWGTVSCYRLTRTGDLFPVAFQVEATHLTVPYVAEDRSGTTDCYAILAADAALAQPFQSYLATKLITRAALLRSTGMSDVVKMAQTLEAVADQLQYPAQYSAAWQEQLTLLQIIHHQLRQQYTQLRATRLLSGAEQPGSEETHLERVVKLIEPARVP